MTAPDLTSPVIGWRAWNPYHAGATRLLHSISIRAVWLPGEVMAAGCAGGLCAQPPALECACGVYAFRDSKLLVSALHQHDFGGLQVVLGEVFLWGKVIEHEDGYRAQFAYPKSFWLWHRASTAREMANLYG